MTRQAHFTPELFNLLTQLKRHQQPRMVSGEQTQVPSPGFYLHLEPGTSFLAGGLWRPDPEPRNRVIAASVTNPAHCAGMGKNSATPTILAARLVSLGGTVPTQFLGE